MKSSKQPVAFLALTILFLFAALGSPVAAVNAKKSGAARQTTANMPPQTGAQAVPVLTIGGKTDTSVYLQSLDIQVEVTGNIASTRYTMVFKNRTNRVLEGELTFPLPDGRTVTGYALDINGKMRDAVPVEKARATQVFEEIQQREIDPGLLERVEGNNFRTRVYPIPASGIRTISIGYEEELTLENEHLYYRLPMAYPEALEKFSVKATVWKSSQKPAVPNSGDELRFDAAGENYVSVFARENYRPSRALIFALPAPAGIPQVMMQPAQGNYYFLASITPKIKARRKEWSDNLAVIWDVSLSGSQRDLRHELEALDIIFAQKKKGCVHLYFLNNRFNKIINRHTSDGSYKIINGKWDELKKVLEGAIFDGGTDFSQVNLNNIIGDEILFFSDGISTLSDPDFTGGANIKNNRPIHSIVSSSKADYNAMRLISGKTNGKFVNINALSPQELKNELQNESPMFLRAEHGDAISEIYPSIATPVQGSFSIAGISGSDNTELTLLFGFGDKIEGRIKVRLDAEKATVQGNVYKIWAQKKIAELDLEYEKNRAELTELGEQFGIVTRNTSLIVLELISDYIRYNIEPPVNEPELLAEYRRGKKNEGERALDTERAMLNSAVAAAENVKKWWDTDFTPPKPKYPIPDGIASRQTGGSDEVARRAETMKARESVVEVNRAVPMPQDDKLMMLREAQTSRNSNRTFAFESAEVIGYLDNPTPSFIINIDDPNSDAAPTRLSSPLPDKARNEKNSQPAITIKPIKQDNKYMKKMTGKTADDYQTYLKLRDDYSNSPAFYFDMSNWFHTHGDGEAALRILTSIAELGLENASLYRLLGYRLKEYGEYALAAFVCHKVIQWRPMEPQSYRDYALALADIGQPQAALDSLYSLLTRPYSSNIARRGTGIEEVVVTEISRLITKNPKLKTSKIDKRLRINTPVDIRVVMNWNMNNTDIDLYVIDPNGEECYYGHRETGSGGRLSADIRSGYGPEQFMLKKAVKGKYRILVSFFNARDFTPDGPSTVMVEIYTKYAGKDELRKVVCVQLSNTKNRGGRKVEVAEFSL